MDASFLIFLQKNPWHMLLAGTAVVTGGMLLWPLASRLFAGTVPQVGPAEAVQLINRRDALVLDVRAPAEFAAGHIPNARNIPLAELGARLREIEKFKARPVVVNCQSGARSAGVCDMLRNSGFGEVFSLRGGIGSWAEASLPVEKGGAAK